SEPSSSQRSNEPSPSSSSSSSSSLPLSSAAAAAAPATVRHGYQLSVMSVGVHTKLYAGFATTGGRSLGEFSFFPSLVSQTRINCPAMERMLGDSLYANRVACAIVATNGARPYFLPKSNSTYS